MYLNNNIYYATLDLMPGVPLNVYALKGSDYSILIDTGIKGMREQILSLCDEVGNIKNVLISHVHADHIGNNVAVKEKTGAKFFAAGAIPWIENLETHYMEFCIPNEHLPDSQQQRNEILGLMDGPVKVDGLLKAGTFFYPGNDVELEVIPLPGHKLEEVGFLNKTTGDLFTGDILLALAAPFFHGFQSSRKFKESTKKMRDMLGNGIVKRIFAAHHHPLDNAKALEAINVTENFLDEVRGNTIKEANGVDFPTLWKNVCSNMNKDLEFRGFAMLDVQVIELVDEGILYKDNGKIFNK
ncbi:MAG TPA: MBL fold metallo-hydrolase [Ignavibacteriaceae bacterium]|nr:MBL fold metallo-hydrolase [Ignavibacteriaceae bacterium]